MTALVGESCGLDRWWDQPFGMFQTNLREIDAGLDVEAVLDWITEFGADTWLVNAGGIYSFYPTELPFQTRNPYLSSRPSGDLLGDAVDAAHRRGIRVMARMDFSKVARPIADAHPEWCFVGPDGRWQVQNGLVSVSPAGEYFQERTFDVLDEVIDRYPVDGFFFNWFGFSEVDYAGRYRGVSQDSASATGFAAFSGGEDLPSGLGSPQYGLWRTWSTGVIRDLAARLHDHVKTRRPDAALMLRQSTDLLFHEANNAVGRELWPSSVSENTSAIRSRYPHTAAVVNSVSFVDMPYRLAGEQPERFAQYLIQAIARGANPSTYIMGTPDDIPYPSLDPASRITRFHATHRGVYAGLRPAAEVGLVRADPLSVEGERQADVSGEFRGLYAALQEEHIPFDVVPADGLPAMWDDRSLKRYRVLLLPDLGALPEQSVSALDAFVAAGGRLVSTGSIGIVGDHSQLADSPIHKVVERHDDPDALKSTYVAWESLSGSRKRGIAPVYGVHFAVDLRAGAQAMHAHLAQAPYGPPEKAYGNEVDGQPGWALSASGAVAVVPWTIGRAYHDIGLASLRLLIRDVVDRILPNSPLLVANLPDCVEVTVQRGPAGLVIHLVNLSGRRRRSFGAVVPIQEGSLVIRDAASARALVTPQDFYWKRLDGALVVQLPPIHEFEVIVVEEGAR
jgi:hypothetical protein